MGFLMRSESTERGGKLPTSMPLRFSLMDRLRDGDACALGTALAAAKALTERIERALPAHAGGEVRGCTEALIAALQATDVQLVVPEFVAELQYAGRASHTG